MSFLIAFVCTGLLFYWAARTLLLLRASEEQIEEVLDCDLWWGRRVWISLRSLFILPNQFAG